MFGGMHEKSSSDRIGKTRKSIRPTSMVSRPTSVASKSTLVVIVATHGQVQFSRAPLVRGAKAFSVGPSGRADTWFMEDESPDSSPVGSVAGASSGVKPPSLDGPDPKASFMGTIVVSGAG